MTQWWGTAMKKVLVTGFEPFGGEAINPALEAVQRLAGLEIDGVKIHVRVLPVVRQKSIDVLVDALRQLKPELVLAIGQAGGRSELSLERVAINVDDYRIPDNEGLQPIDEPVVVGGPAAYWSTLPLKAMVAAARQAGIPAGVSNTAGTFVCNHLFYGLMNFLEQSAPQVRAGFVHIPYLPEQAARQTGQPSMAVGTIVQGLKIFIETALVTKQDLCQSGGTIC